MTTKLQAQIDNLDKRLAVFHRETRKLERERELALAQLHPPLSTKSVYPDLPETKRIFA